MSDSIKYAIVANQSGLFIGEIEQVGMLAVTLLHPMAIVMQQVRGQSQVQMSLQPLLIPCRRVSLPNMSMLWEEADLTDDFKARVITEYVALQVQKRSGIQLVK